MTAMAVEVKKLDLRLGDVVKVAGRWYDVVSDRAGGIAVEPAITVTARDLHERDGTRPATPEELERVFGNLRTDGEG